MPKSKVITLLTDFSQRDGFVGTMKGVILRFAPEVQIVDISHDIEPQDVDAGAFVLHCAYRFFPQNTVHVVVIDPGVGSARRILAARAGGHLFLAPDNGVLKYLWREHPDAEVRAVQNSSLYLPEVSQTFHGRDIFAPVAGRLATGLPLDAVGPLVTDYQLGEVREPEVRDGEIVAIVLYIDRFGNLITNVPAEIARGLTPTRLVVHDRRWPLRGLSRSYAEGEPGRPIAIIGSSEYLEVAVNAGNAATLLGVKVGDSLRIQVSEPAAHE